MNIKPKKTTFNPKALVYRRISKIESSLQESIVYKCLQDNGVAYQYFIFDKDKNEFAEIYDIGHLNAKEYRVVTSQYQVFKSNNTYFHWNTTINPKNTWVATDTLPQNYTTLADAGFSNIGKYQMNAYYFVGQIDYIITGEVAGTKTQPIKGIIMDLESMNIKYYNDDIVIGEEDLVVVGGKLFSAESPDYSIKHMPRPYTIRYVTLNSIL